MVTKSGVRGWVALGAGLTLAAVAWARLPLERIELVALPPLDLAAVAAEDAQRDAEGQAPRFAIPNAVVITPFSHGTWEELDAENLLWRLRVNAPGALSLNFGFSGFYLPEGAKLWIHAVDNRDELRLITAADNAPHGEFWSPVVLSDDVVFELTVPRVAQGDLFLMLTSVNVGYRYFGEDFPEAGTCNIDVVCPQGDDWRNEIATVGVISTGGSTFCTGFMVNNTAVDSTPYFMTARHCGITSSNAASLVVYWNFQSPTCGQQGGGSLAQWQSGSFWKAQATNSDFTLVLLDEDPNPAWEVAFAGWDKTSANATSACGIHHPNTDEKSISFEYQPTTTTTYLGTSVPGDGTHVRITDWDVGTTEPGSSGSPLFNQAHRVIGQLHGGYAACGNDSSDWYGRFSVSWGQGLAAFLDPLNTGQSALDTYNPWAIPGLRVTPNTQFVATGDPGGPFSPSSVVYTLENELAVPMQYAVTKTATWLTLTNGSGTIPAGQTVQVTVSINAAANSFGFGEYTDTLTFANLTDGHGDTARTATLTVGAPQQIYFWNLNTNPGWTTQGQWAWGQPTGGGGQYGNNDPTSGFTGQNVYGYNLSGDYTNSMPEYHLTSTAIDCSNLFNVSVKFYRWLNVEKPQYDHAYFRVSNNGTTWTTIWENGATITDSSWNLVEYDISAVADGKATVYLRWTMGTTDSSWLYSGWNIDDIAIWGVNQCAAPSILTSPQNTQATAGHPCSLSVSASGTSLSYQWRKGGQPVGGNTATLWLMNPTTADAGTYDCVVSSTGCGAATSDPATLAVYKLGDMNCDGSVNFADINLFVDALSYPGGAGWPHACPWLNADCEIDNAVNFKDINAFVNQLGQ